MFKDSPVFRYFSVTTTNLFFVSKNINPENFLWKPKQEFPCQSLESFSEEYYNMENKILDFQFGNLLCMLVNYKEHNKHLSKKFSDSFLILFLLMKNFQEQCASHSYQYWSMNGSYILCGAPKTPQKASCWHLDHPLIFDKDKSGRHP